MQIHPASDVIPDGRGFIARQSRFQGVVAAVVMTGILGGIPVVTWYFGAHWLLWTISGGIALLIVPLIVSDAAARFRRTNWLLWLDPDGLWINLRSYQTGHDGDPPTVVRLRYDEIASAAQRVETYLLYRAAELTVEQGFSCFAIEDRATDRNVETRVYRDPFGPGPYAFWRPWWRYRGSWGWRRWDPWYGDPFWADNIDVRTVQSFEANAEIVMSRSCRDDDRRSFEAREVIANLRPTIVYPGEQR